MEPGARRAERRRRDGRVPEGTLLVVGGQRSLDDPGAARSLRRRMAEMVAGYAEMHPDLKVLSGLRPGAEALGAEAAVDAGADWAAVLPWPDPQRHLRPADREHFDALLAAAPGRVLLEKKVPADRPGRAKALARRDAWLASVADLALVAWDGEDDDVRAFLVRFERAIPDDVTVLW